MGSMENEPRMDTINGHVIGDLESEQIAIKRANDAAKDAAEEQAAVQRGAWGGKLEFILTCIGSAVGLGNVWRFPYLCYKNGGGAFLIPYVLMLAFVGIPIFFFEVCFGQFSSLGPIKIWLVSPIAKGIGFGMVSIVLLIALSYNIVITWAVYYFVRSLTTNFPWANCENDWNDNKCLTSSNFSVVNGNERILNETLAERNLKNRAEFETASHQFYYGEMLKMSGSIEDFGVPSWELVLCLLFCWTLVFLALIKGINSLGKVVYVVAIFPYVLITCMLIFSATLPGAGEGIRYYIEPKFDRLLEAQVWSDAATQIFYSLSACTGALSAMASYNKFDNNCYRDSLIVPLVNCCTSVYAGFAVFAVLGFIANMKGVPVSEVADQGPGLVFIVYPEALSQMPVPTLWSILFFIMLIMLGFSSLFSAVETVFVAIMDEFPRLLRSERWRPIAFRAVCCTIFFGITIPMVCNGGFYLFNLVDSATGGFPLLIVGLFEITSIMWMYGASRFSDDVSMMLGKRPNIFYRFTWAILTPLILLVIIIVKGIQFVPVTIGSYHYPDWGHAIYWMTTIYTVMWIPLVALYMTCTRGGWEVVKQVSRPRKRWGPALAENRTGRYAENRTGLYAERANTISRELPYTRKLATNEMIPLPTITGNEKGRHNDGYIDGERL